MTRTIRLSLRSWNSYSFWDLVLWYFYDLIKNLFEKQEHYVVVKVVNSSLQPLILYFSIIEEYKANKLDRLVVGHYS